MNKAKSLSSILVALTVASVASVDFLVPSSEIDFETRKSNDYEFVYLLSQKKTGEY